MQLYKLMGLSILKYGYPSKETYILLNDMKALQPFMHSPEKVHGRENNLWNLHSHIAIVVTPPSLKSFANQKNLSNHRVVIRKNPLQITSDLQRVFLYDHSVI